MSDPSIYDYLAKQNLSELTVENLDSASKNTSIDPSNVEFWAGVITISRALQESRCYAWGHPIPESGVVGQASDIAGGVAIPLQPSGTELWRVTGMDVTGSAAGVTFELYMSDGTNDCLIDSGTVGTTKTELIPNGAISTLITSATMFLKIKCTETGADTLAISYAYDKVGL